VDAYAPLDRNRPARARLFLEDAVYVFKLHTERTIETKEGVTAYLAHLTNHGWTKEQMRELAKTGKVERRDNDFDGPVHTSITLEEK